LTDSHVKLKILDDTQELLNSSHHNIVFNYDEGIVSLVDVSAHTASEISLPNNSDSSAGNATKVFEYYCYDIEADAS
jgi:hypothetical protein